MARARSTPYSAQLDRFLAEQNGNGQSFSAASLEAQFTHPPRQKRGTNIGGIHKALWRAFADGKVIAYVNDENERLREAAIVVPGSKAVGQPLIFGMPGAPSPDDAYHAVTYDESRQRGLPSESEPDDENATDDDADVQPADDVGEDDAGVAYGGGGGLTADDVGALTRLYLKEPPATAPEWIPGVALRAWSSLKAVSAHWRKRQSQEPMQERLALIAAGVPRKGQISPDSMAARGLAQLCRRPGPFWGDTVHYALRQYLADEVMPSNEELAEFADAPIDFYIERSDDYSPFVLLLAAVLIGLDDEYALGELAEECVRQSQESAAPEDDEQERSALLAQVAEANKALKDAGKELRAAQKRAEALATDLARAREASQQAGDEALSDALGELAALRSELEQLREDAAHVIELEAQVQALERSRDALLSESRSAERERQLREEIEGQGQDQLRQIGELTAQLRAAHESGAALPTQDGPSLLRALTRPVGEAARYAAERLTVSQSLQHDEELFAFATALMKTAKAMGADPAAPTALPEPKPAAAQPLLTALALAPDAGVEQTPSPVSDELATVADEPKIDEAPVATIAAADPIEGAPQDAVAAPARSSRRRADTWFTVRPMGGAGEIGGSALLIETPNRHRVLLDAGQRVKGEYGIATANPFHHGVRGIDHLHGILISHAHIDHVGSLPLLWRFHSDQQEADVPVWMSEPTRELAEIMLKDSAKIQHAREYERSVLGESDFDADSMIAAYDQDLVNAVLGSDELHIAHPYQPIRIPETSLAVKFLPVSHVLGSCAIHLTDTDSGHTLLYTGDLGPISQPQLTLPDFSGTELIERADTVIMESTYGVLRDTDREGKQRSGAHGREREVNILFDSARATLDRGGFVLMPSFSLGRTQELVRLIGERIERVPIYIGGMGERIFEIYDEFQRRENGRWVRPGTYPRTTPIGKWLRQATFEEVVEDVLGGEPGFIIASPAMLSGGWSRAFLRRMIDDPRHAIIFSGYLPRHTAGIPRLREMGKNRMMRFGDEQVRIQCDWLSVGLSAHAPGPDLRQFARDMTTGDRHVNFGLVHGEPASQRELAADIGQLDNATAKSLTNSEPWSPTRE